jgi:hypothetical protein
VIVIHVYNTSLNIWKFCTSPTSFIYVFLMIFWIKSDYFLNSIKRLISSVRCNSIYNCFCMTNFRLWGFKVYLWIQLSTDCTYIMKGHVRWNSSFQGLLTSWTVIFSYFLLLFFILATYTEWNATPNILCKFVLCTNIMTRWTGKAAPVTGRGGP